VGLALKTEDKRNGEQLGPKTMCEEGVSYEADVWENYSLDLEELRGKVIWKVLSFYKLVVLPWHKVPMNIPGNLSTGSCSAKPLFCSPPLQEPLAFTVLGQ